MDNPITGTGENTINELIPFDSVCSQMGCIIQFYNRLNFHVIRANHKIYMFALMTWKFKRL